VASAFRRKSGGGIRLPAKAGSHEPGVRVAWEGVCDEPVGRWQWGVRQYRSPHSVGTYTVEDNCSGTITFNGPMYDMFLSKDGDDISMIQTNPTTVFQGLATRTSRGVREFSQD